MPKTRVFIGSSLINDKIYIFGGRYDGGGSNTRVFEMYDPSNDSWTTKTQMPDHGSSNHWFTEGCVLNNKLYVIWGDVNEIYDPSANSWSTGSSPDSNANGVAGGSSSTFVLNSKCYVIRNDYNFFEYCNRSIYSILIRHGLKK